MLTKIVIYASTESRKSWGFQSRNQATLPESGPLAIIFKTISEVLVEINMAGFLGKHGRF